MGHRHSTCRRIAGGINAAAISVETQHAGRSDRSLRDFDFMSAFFQGIGDIRSEPGIKREISKLRRRLSEGTDQMPCAIAGRCGCLLWRCSIGQVLQKNLKRHLILPVATSDAYPANSLAVTGDERGG